VYLSNHSGPGCAYLSPLDPISGMQGRGANVIGGSDDPADRIAPDGVRAVRKGERTMLLNTLRSQTRATRAKLPR
tara:strand:- start:9637 stop:9861 length:225 start_codon:yes stop_codon:yes gene_type:complete